MVDDEKKPDVSGNSVSPTRTYPNITPLHTIRYRVEFILHLLHLPNQTCYFISLRYNCIAISFCPLSALIWTMPVTVTRSNALFLPLKRRFPEDPILKIILTMHYQMNK